MTVEEAVEVVRRLVDAFNKGDCSSLPTTEDVRTAAKILATAVQQKTPDIPVEDDGSTTLTSELAKQMEALADAARRAEQARKDAETSHAAIADALSGRIDGLPESPK